MTDHDASPPPNLRPQRAARHSVSPYREADTADGSLLSAAAPDSASASATATPSADFELPTQTPPNPIRSHAEKRLSAGVHRAHKPRPSGGFLLADPLLHRHNSARRDAT